MSVFIVVLLWHNYRASKRNVVQLKALNDEIQIKNAVLGKAFNTLEHSYETNSRITRLVAHDLRGPIVAMRNFIQVINNNALPPEEKNKIGKTIQANCTDALSLIEDMLNKDTSDDQLTLATFDLSDLVEHCIDQLEIRSKAKKQQVEFFKRPAMIMGDAEKLRRVFDNLLTNAIKFTDVRGIIRITMRVTEADVIISIADNGIGIPENIRQKLFDFSTDTKRRGTANEPSHGLGLFICRQIIEVHKGSIWFNQPDGRGAVFNVMLHRYLV